MSSIVIAGDTSGTITLQAPAVSGSNTLSLPAATDTLAGNNSLGIRNRIINGNMVIDQRNAGASVTPNLLSYPVDRTFGFGSVTGKFSCQQNSGSVTPPAGFTNYIGAVSLSAYSVGSGEQYIFCQVIEGLNVADLGWGTAAASTVTLSFWVRSSLTGTFGGALQNDGFTRSYPFSYTISAANTWEQKTITVAGDTSGTWLKTNGAGIRLEFSLGAGSTMSGTAGAWAGANYVSATGAVSVVGTSGATFYITGVQLEAGSVATPFERRPYGMELALCQRYALVLGGTNTNENLATGWSTTTGSANLWLIAPVSMRSSPSVLASGSFTIQLFNNSTYSTTGISINNGETGQTRIGIAATVSSMTANIGCILRTSDINGRLTFSAEL